MAQLDQAHHVGLIGAAARAPAEHERVRTARREPGFATGWLVAPAVLWLLLFLVVPLLSIFVFSFWSHTGHGMTPDLSLHNYAEFFSVEGFSTHRPTGFSPPACSPARSARPSSSPSK